MRDELRQPWNTLEVAKLIISLLTPLLLFWVGYIANESIRDSEEARDRIEQESREARVEFEKQRQLARTRQSAVQSFSKFIYERRARAELLASALKRHAARPVEASRSEVIERKKLYDEAYFRWNSNHQANLLLVRQVLGSENYSTFESLVEFRLVRQVFAPLDACLTRAYDSAIRDGDPRPLLKNCKANQLLQQALDCGYAITDELFKLSGSGQDHLASVSIVNERCP